MGNTLICQSLTKIRLNRKFTGWCPFYQTPQGKENRAFSLSSLCVGSKASSASGIRDPCTPSTFVRPSSALSSTRILTNKTSKDCQDLRSSPCSHFHSWKKRRSAVSMKKSKSVCPSIGTSVAKKKDAGCGTSPLR